jgi:hypothetical protein
MKKSVLIQGQIFKKILLFLHVIEATIIWKNIIFKIFIREKSYFGKWQILFGKQAYFCDKNCS